MKTATITIYSKDPDGWGELQDELGLSDEKVEEYFEFGEYATLELEISSSMKVVGGRVLPQTSRR